MSAVYEPTIFLYDILYKIVLKPAAHQVTACDPVKFAIAEMFVKIRIIREIFSLKAVPVVVGKEFTYHSIFRHISNKMKVKASVLRAVFLRSYVSPAFSISKVRQTTAQLTFKALRISYSVSISKRDKIVRSKESELTIISFLFLMNTISFFFNKLSDLLSNCFIPFFK